MFSLEQKTAAANIQDVFSQGTTRYALLKSQCQSGKTGAYQVLISSMLCEGTIQRAYILCGSHELELRSQAIDDTKTHNYEAYARGDIEVFFRQDFASAVLNVTNALIIVDESHLDQTKGQQLDTFLYRHGLSMDGNPKTLTEKNAFIVSVDATPYSELAALEHKETPYLKHVEELKPGASYVGIGQYLYSGLLQSTFDISSNTGRFMSLLNGPLPKYALLRLASGRKGNRNAHELAVEKVARYRGWRVLSYTAAQTDIAITRNEQLAIKKDTGRIVPCLEDAPTTNTYVVIRGRLRAGKVVPKKHIAFVWEGAKSSNTDALVQGLAGRMCGYTQNLLLKDDPMKLDGYGNLPSLFVPSSSLERHEKKVVKSSEIERAILVPDLLPTKSTNVKKPRVDSIPSNGLTACVPLRITLPVEDDDNYHGIFDGDDDVLRGELCRKELLKHLAIVTSSAHLTTEQKTEILASVPTAPARVRNIRQKNAEAHHQMLREVMKAYDAKTVAPNHVVSQHDSLNFIITHPCLRSVVGANSRHLYVIFYTKSSLPFAGTVNAPLSARIPETNGRSIFSFSERATAAPLIAAGATGFSEKDIKTPDSFEKALRAYLTHWKTSELTVSREIQSNSSRFILDKGKFHYMDAKTNDIQRICAKIGGEFGVKMNVKFARSSAGTRGHFNVKSISW
jgi:hypothetical protein